MQIDGIDLQSILIIVKYLIVYLCKLTYGYMICITSNNTIYNLVLIIHITN